MERPKIRPLAGRRNLVSLKDFAKVLPPVSGFETWFESLPEILGARDLKSLVRTWREVRSAGGMVGLALGAHVIKVGLSPLLIDLMQRGFVGHIATNGAAAIHDYEFALQGGSSEDVEGNLRDGSFGFWKETFEGLNGVLAEAQKEGVGFGLALGRSFLESKLPHVGCSLFAEAARLGIPVTVHVAFGCDIVHMDPDLDPGALGRATHEDFLRLSESVAGLDGGLWVNMGSAVLMPEVFLKALSLGRNLGRLGRDFTTANLDMIPQYRALRNVVDRPSDKGLNILGQHEILLPLLHQALISGGV